MEIGSVAAALERYWRISSESKEYDCKYFSNNLTGAHTYL